MHSNLFFGLLAFTCVLGSLEAIETKGVLLTSGSEKDVDLKHIEGIEVQEIEVPGGLPGLKKVLTPFLQQPLTPQLLIEIKRAIILYYRKQHHPIVTVLIPEQDISQGVVQIVIIEGKLGKIICKGNKWFSDSLIKSFLDIEPGDAISDDTLLTDVTWMNRNPFRRTDVLFKPGEAPGTTDIELRTKDRFPVRFYAGGDNTGNDATGNDRWYVGMNWGHAFWCDHTLSYQYTTSSDFRSYQAHTFQYTAPLSWRHILLVFGGYGEVNPDLSSEEGDFEEFKSHGHSAQASLRYQIPVGRAYHSKILEPFFGCDFKNTNNNLEFIGDDTIPIITKTVNITQVVGGINWGKQTGHHQFTCSLDSYWSPGQIVPNQSNDDFGNLRHGAKNKYIYGRGTAGDVYRFPVKCALSLLARGQYSSQNLLPSEQFTIGGFNTVRGFEERELMVDNGFIGNFEVRSHAFHLFRKAHDELLFLAFTDYGIGGNHKKIPGEKPTQYLWSAGPGLRYTISSYLSLRVDWGFKLHRIRFDDSSLSKVHFGVIASY